MNKKSLVIALFLSAILLGGWLFSALVPGGATPAPQPETATMKKSGAPLMEFEGLTFSTYQGKELQSRVKVKMIRAAPRKLYIFRIRSIDELLLSNVEVEIFQQEKSQAIDLLPMTEMQDRVSGAMMVKGGGRITQGHILSFSATIRKNGVETLRVAAQEAFIDFSRHKMTMHHANLYQPGSQRQISSPRIDWDSRERRFIIPGEYHERRGEKRSHGAAVIVDSDLVMVTIPQPKK